MRTTMIRSLACAALGAGVLAAATGTFHAAGENLAAVRAATAPYHRHQVAVDDGFDAELADLQGLTCIEDPSGTGAMGTHWLNIGEIIDGEIDATEPEVLLYDMSGPEPRLLGVEYVVFVDDWEGAEPPELFGHEFHLVDAPNRFGLPAFYELHVWIWYDNPNGMFEDWNPRVSC